MVLIAKRELECGKEFDEISEKLEQEMQTRWKLVSGTRKQYLDIIKKVLNNQFVLTYCTNRTANYLLNSVQFNE